MTENKVMKFRGGTVTLERPLIFGIVNATPDSFFAPSRCENVKKALERAATLVAEGSDFLDIGAESTKPGSQEVSVAEEKARLLPILKAVREAFPQIFLSVDTRRAEVAELALAEGASIINDVSSLSDPLMAKLLAETGAGVILSHAPNLCAKDVDVSIEEIKKFLEERTKLALEAGVKEACIIWDPGLGFSKTPECNWNILKNLEHLLDYPVMCGASHKRFTRPNPFAPETPENDGTQGTIKAHALALKKGARLFRVHDVKICKETLKVA